MKRRLFTLTLALFSLICQFSLPFETGAQTPGPRRGSTRRGAITTNAVNARFNQIADAYLRGYYAFNPTEATRLGQHEYDRALESRGPQAIAREVRRLRTVQSELARIWEGGLSPDARYDYLVINSHVRAQLLELEDVRFWQRDPNIYNNLASASIDNMLKRNYAPIEQRLDAVLAREREIPRLLDEARANLQQPPRIYTEMAINQVRGSVDYFSHVVPQMFERAGGGRLSAARKSEFETTNQATVSVMRSFGEWLERDLLPRSSGNFAIGAENYRRKLLYEEMIDTPLNQLINDGERELRRTQEEMRTLAEEVAPGRGVVYALRLLGRDHPDADGLVGDARAELTRIRAFVRTQKILTPPTQENLIVAETPEYARATSFASLDAPGPFERVASEAFFYVTPPDPEWNAQRREQHLSFYNRYTLPIVSIHEVYPGHYYQFAALKRQPSRVRTALASASFVEGWAHYCEQMMLDEGFGGNNPRLRLAQESAALVRLCRYLVGLRLHTAGMSYEEAVEFFEREGYQERAVAEREARRGTEDPTYLVYTLGKMEIMRLRDEVQRRMGASFNLTDFHDRLLSYGMPPVKIIRLAMLGDLNSTLPPAPTVTNEQLNRVDFSVLATGAMSAYAGARTVQLIMSPNEWQSAWATIGGGHAAPDVNFNTRAVIIAYQGRKPLGGYGISIAQILRDGKQLTVRVSEQTPGVSAVHTQVLTSPFVAVSIPRPPAGSIVKFEDEVKKTEQNRYFDKRNYRTRRAYRKPAPRP